MYEGKIGQSAVTRRLMVRVKIADLPQDEEGLKKWCEDAWARKDKLLADMLADMLADPKADRFTDGVSH